MSPIIILFCGRPGCWKTSIASMLAGRLGLLYVPTRLGWNVAATPANRSTRYAAVADVVAALTRLGGGVVVDGSWLQSADRAALVRAVDPVPVVVVLCTATSADRVARLRRRASNDTDHERDSAASVLAEGEQDPHTDDPARDTFLDVVIEVATSRRSVEVIRPGATPTDIIVGVIEAWLAGVNAPDLTVRTHFDTLADSYDDTTEWRRDPEILASLVRPLAKHPARVLDVGTGTGLASRHYADEGHHVVGVDLSAKMLARSPSLACAVLSDAANMPFPNQSFDCVLVRQVLHYVEVATVLGECRRVLRADGALAVCSIVAGHEEAAAFLAEFKATTQPLRRTVFTEASLVCAMRDHDLVIEDILRLRRPRVESLASLAARTSAPARGWAVFLDACQRIATEVAPDLQFRVSEDRLSYIQEWVTIWARPHVEVAS